MSTVILCQTRKAQQPFYVNDTGMNLYSAEELCYFMEHNLPLLDRVFFAEPLQEWLRAELGLDRLADRLHERCEAEELPHLEELALPVFDEISWLTAEEKTEILRQLQELENLPVPEREKLRADSLTGYRRYMLAIRLYRDILQLAGENSPVTGKVWHNMGVAYAGMFQMEEACDCFRKAWEAEKSDVSLRCLLCCSALHGGQEEFDRTADDCGADMEFRTELEDAIEALKKQEMPADPEAALRGWVREYHLETGL